MLTEAAQEFVIYMTSTFFHTEAAPNVFYKCVHVHVHVCVNFSHQAILPALYLPAHFVYMCGKCLVRTRLGVCMYVCMCVHVWEVLGEDQIGCMYVCMYVCTCVGSAW